MIWPMIELTGAICGLIPAGIEPTTVAFDDFAGGGSDADVNRAILGLA